VNGQALLCAQHVGTMCMYMLWSEDGGNVCKKNGYLERIPSCVLWHLQMQARTLLSTFTTQNHYCTANSLSSTASMLTA
jgi:hypothetical protein